MINNLRISLEERAKNLIKANKDLLFRKKILERCKEDTNFFFENFVWGYDPRQDDASIPFFPYPRQAELIAELDGLLKNPMDTFIDKPRDMGVTTIIMNLILKHWIFDEGFNAKVGSRKEEYVDRGGSTDTLFHKIDYTMRFLPKWMIPAGTERTYMTLRNTNNSNTITGESANPSFARGGRQRMVFFDEIGFWPNAQSSWESAGDVTNFRLAVTTPPPEGQASFAYKLRSGKSGKLKLIELDYSDVPWKTAEWLEKEKERRSTEELEREILKSYSGTSKDKVYMVDWNSFVVVTPFEYRPDLPLFVSWDFGLDAYAMIWWQKDYSTNRVYLLDSYTNTNKPTDFYIPFVTGIIKSGGYDYTQKELEKIRKHSEWRKDITHFGDPDVKKRNRDTLSSTKELLMSHGIYVQTASSGKEHFDLKQKAVMLMRRLYVNPDGNEELITAMLSSRYPEPSLNSTSELNKPVHDGSSHFRTSFEYFADNEPFYQTPNPLTRSGNTTRRGLDLDPYK